MTRVAGDVMDLMELGCAVHWRRGGRRRRAVGATAVVACVTAVTAVDVCAAVGGLRRRPG